MFLVTMEKIAQAKGFDTFINYERQTIEIEKVFETISDTGYWHKVYGEFEETSDTAFNMFITDPEEYMDIYY